jgi:arsenate reductase
LGRYATHLEQDDIMDHITIWHNPRCSKSRVTLGLLQERGVDPVQVKYLENPPTDTELRAALIALGITPFELIRRSEAVFKELNLSKASTDDELVSAMASHPILIERPIVFAGKKAVIGRPPENALRLLDD